MQAEDFLLRPNPLVQFLRKEPRDFTRADLVRFIESKGIEMLNFRYVAEDGKLKTLSFVLQGREHLESVLTYGERVDGSSLFSFVDAGSSDLYLVPRYRTAFLNPFASVPTLDILCSFYNNEGKPLENAPDYVLRKAIRQLRAKTGLNMKVFGELEYYVNSLNPGTYDPFDQHGYHSSQPFAKWEELRLEAMRFIAGCGGAVKYGHAEVGSYIRDKELFEQHEIEFLPCNVEEAAEQLVISKWILRMLGYKHGVEISFAPKISVGKAGSGLHIHMLLERDGHNCMTEKGELSREARALIAGVLTLSESLTAFGNTIPTSYLRLVPHQEAPTRICWGSRNRSVLVRVPLGWTTREDMITDANPLQPPSEPQKDSRQTVEFRAPDGSADIYALIAGLVVAAGYGLEMPGAQQLADDLFVDRDIFKDPENEKIKKLRHLPSSCWDSAVCLARQREFFEKDNVFPKGMVDNLIRRLQSYEDRNLSERLFGKDDEIRELVIRYIHTM